MNHKLPSLPRRVVTWGLLPLAAAALGEEKSRPLESAEKVSVSFNVLLTSSHGATGTPTMSMLQDLAPGQTFVGDAMGGMPFSFGVGGSTSGCDAGLSIEPPDSQLNHHPLAWSADAKLLEASTDRIVLDASWRRLEQKGPGGPVESTSDTVERVSLREADRLVLDFARVPGCRNALLEITAKVKEDPAFATLQIAYELWLVHESGGKTTSARAQLTGSQGESVAFAFPRQKLPVLATGEGLDQRLEVAVTGRLRGRARRGGTLELALDTARGLSYVAPDGGSDGGISESGLKVIAVRPGEAIRVELPDTPREVASGDPRAPRMARDMAGHTFAMVVRARPLS